VTVKFQEEMTRYKQNRIYSLFLINHTL